MTDFDLKKHFEGTGKRVVHLVYPALDKLRDRQAFGYTGEPWPELKGNIRDTLIDYGRWLAFQEVRDAIEGVER